MVSKTPIKSGAAIFVWAVCLALALSIAASCSKKGGEGAVCSKPADCEYGFRCEDGKCIGGTEGACSYLTRCIPKLSFEDKETIFGEDANQLVEMLKKRPNEAGCEARLRLVAQMNRTVVLNRACGPRVTK